MNPSNPQSSTNPSNPQGSTSPPSIQSNTVPNPTGDAAQAAPPVVTAPSGPGTSKSKMNVEVRYQTLIAGLLANFDPASSFPLPTGTFTRDELVAILQKRIAAGEASKSAKTAWHSTVEAERQAEADLSPLRKPLQQSLAGRFGASGAQMAEFGFAPAKPRKVSAKTKAAAAVKAKATRQARGTMGKKQKKDVKGGVTAVLMTPVTAPPPITAPAAPAPAPAAPVPTTSPQPATPSAAR